MDGFLYINKEAGWTSRDVCNKVQSLFHIKKVGHIGTLDPFATGLLIVTLGRGTKAGRFLEDSSKEYVATLELGKKTSTGDFTGEIVETKDVTTFSKEKLDKILSSFIGEYDQLPPMTSAIKVNGVKLYDLAHQGKEIERKTRRVKIHELECLSFTSSSIKFRCVVSKGTYVRTLGEDIAEKLGCVGYLSSLNRTKIAHAELKDAKKINEISENDLIAISKGLSHMEKVVLDDKRVEQAKSGMMLKFDLIKNTDTILLVDKNDCVIAVYERKQNDGFICLRGLW